MGLPRDNTESSRENGRLMTEPRVILTIKGQLGKEESTEENAFLLKSKRTKGIIAQGQEKSSSSS